MNHYYHHRTVTVVSNNVMIRMIKQSISSSNSSLMYRSCCRHMLQQQQLLRFKSSIPATNTTATSRIVDSTTKTNTYVVKTSSVSSMNGIVSALIAATAGIITVSGITNSIEYMTSFNVPIFDVTQKRYDNTTYSGRVMNMLLQCDPYLLCYTNKQIIYAKQLIDEYNYTNTKQQQSNTTSQQSHDEIEYNNTIKVQKSTEDDEVTTSKEMNQYYRTLWEAKRLVDSSMNDSGCIIPRPFRMSGYVPYNGPICVAMVSSSSTVSLLFWSWINQSQNALVNYYNRSNSSQPMDMNNFIQSYCIAVSSALLVAFGLATIIQKRYSPKQAQAFLRYVAFPSAVIASSLNCYIVRSSEITTGIPLLDEDGNNVLDVARKLNMISMTESEIHHDHESMYSHEVVDHHHHDDSDTSTSTSETSSNDITTSKIAAKRGVYATTASRAILQAPVYFLPPILVSTMFRTIIQHQPQFLLPITTYLVLCSFGFGLPMACAIFPQTSTIVAKDVEQYPFQQLINPKTQQPYTIFYYDKGL